MPRPGCLLFAALIVFGLPAAARAQQTIAPSGCSVKWDMQSDDFLIINQNHYRLLRKAQINCNDLQLFADEVEVFSDADRMRASGNVVFVSQNNRISAERMEFNTRTKTGTFYIASGIANLENRGVDRSLFGSQEPDAYFWGETIEKLGPRTYKITHGGFTTCVQPTPRWEMVSNSVTLTLEDHAYLKNALLKVKDVPLFYLPAMYYPINKEDRATGLLIPIYGSSNIRGQSITNRFFWAIDRSQDATFEHDYYSKTGEGFGGEYRYIQAPGSSGTVDGSFLEEHAAVYTDTNGLAQTYDGGESYRIHGSAIQALPWHLRAAGSTYYFSSLATEQRYNYDIYAATNRQRNFNGSLTGNWGATSAGVTVDRQEYVTDDNNSQTAGSMPRLTFSRAEKRIFDLPVYWGVSSEYVTLERSAKANAVTSDSSLSRIDFLPGLRFPFTKWSFLTFNSTLQFRDTYYTESIDAGVQSPEGLNRHYFAMGTTITGPVLQHIWNTPRLRYAQKFKHVIEPVFTVSRVTAIPEANRIVLLDSVDYIVGSVTSFSYGVNNRVYAKKDTAREILDVSINQSYYTDATAAQRDAQYQSSLLNASTAGTAVGSLPPTHLSPIAVQVHATPTPLIDATFRTEYDTQVHDLRTLAANGGFTRGWISTQDGWSLRRYIPLLTGFNDPLSATQYPTSSTTVRKPGNGLGGVYSFNYDIKNRDYLNQRIMGYYNTQCCGIIIEYQKFNYGAAVQAVGVAQDHRFNISFSLAGIGTFSDLFGAFGGQKR